MEEVPDEDDIQDATSVQPFPGPAGEVYGSKATQFEDLRKRFQVVGQDLYHPFADEEEWQLAETLMTRSMSLQQIDKLLKLPIMCNRTQTSYKDKCTLLQKIDALPSLGPSFKCETITVTGDIKDSDGNFVIEELELFHRDPVECVQELIGNPAFHTMLHYAPEQIFEDASCTERIYNEMWTADWWWEIQQKLPPGVTIAPLIIASDKTQLSQFSGDKSAWPVYLTIGNIAKATRHQPSKRTCILLGYIPVSKLTCFTKPQRSSKGHELFHYCMRKILEPIIKAGCDGVDMMCADGGIR
ncbi:hypothetical protein K439DRAFT_1649164 [Ramaria rubella]|nr:hypothetical protein K439DRAFT_1649164 [Ramaria rubella]